MIQIQRIFFYFSLTFLFFILGCGKGDDSVQPSSPLNTAPVIFSAPIRFAKANTPYSYRVIAVDSEHDTVKFSLTKAPTGMSINPATGELSWVPTSDQGGGHSVEISVTDDQASDVQIYTVTVETSKVVTSKLIMASAGGIVEVSDQSSLLYGSRVEIPPGVLSQDVTVSISQVSNPINLPQRILVMEISTSLQSASVPEKSGSKFITVNKNLGEPAIQLSSATITYPQSLVDSVGDEGQLKLYFLDTFLRNEWREVVADDSLLHNHEKNTFAVKVPFKIKTFPFGFREKTIDDVLNARFAVGTSEDVAAEQERIFWVVRGTLDGFRANTSGRNLLLIHGTRASCDSFIEPSTESNGLIFYFTRSSYYQNILCYNYPWSESIRNNGKELVNFITNLRLPGSFDIIAHSMGGAVGRYSIENKILSMKRNVRNLFMLTTPNSGVDKLIMDEIVQKTKITGQGEADLTRDSEFLNELNLSQDPWQVLSEGKTFYYLFTADRGDGFDEFIWGPFKIKFIPVPLLAGTFLDPSKILSWDTDMTIPLFRLIPGINAWTFGYCGTYPKDHPFYKCGKVLINEKTPYNHHTIHNDCANNGVCDAIYINMPSSLRLVSPQDKVIVGNSLKLKVEGMYEDPPFSPVQDITSLVKWEIGSVPSDIASLDQDGTFTARAVGNVAIGAHKNGLHTNVIVLSIVSEPSPPTTFTLSVRLGGTGSGAVTSLPAGINCGSDCSEPYNSGTMVTLTAAPEMGSTFAGWSECTNGSWNTCNVTVDAGKVVTATFNVMTSPPDTTPPDTLIDSGPPASTTSTSATFTFHSTKIGSTFACRLDSGSFTPCTSAQNYSGLTIGSHTFSVQATDTAGNTDMMPATYTWLISGSAPFAPDGLTAVPGNGQATMSWNVVGDATSYNLYWNTSSPVTKSTGFKIEGVRSPFFHAGLTNGVTYFYTVTALNANGESDESNTVSATPDTSDWANSVAVDASTGAIYVVGSTQGNFDGNNIGVHDLFLTKYDSSRVKQWTRQLGTPNADEAFGVAVNPNTGDVYVTGATYGNLDGNINAGGADLLVIKYNSSGGKEWSRQFGTAGDDFGRSIAVDPNTGAIYIAGYYRTPTAGGVQIVSPAFFLVKYDSSGTVEWVQRHELNFWFPTLGFGISVAPDTGSVYSVGYTGHGLDGNTHVGGWDLFLIKYNSSGARQWTRQLGTLAGDGGDSVAVDPNTGDVYITGETAGSFDGNTNAGGFDLFLVKYDSSGVKQWSRQLGTSSTDEGRGVAVDPSSGAIYVTGRTEGSLDSNTNVGGYDIFLIKYDSTGVKQWTRQLGTPGDDEAYGITVDPDSGVIHITGKTDGNLDTKTKTAVPHFFLVTYDASGIKQ